MGESISFVNSEHTSPKSRERTEQEWQHHQLGYISNNISLCTSGCRCADVDRCSVAKCSVELFSCDVTLFRSILLQTFSLATKLTQFSTIFEL